MKGDRLCFQTCEEKSNELQYIADDDYKDDNEDETGDIVQDRLSDLLEGREDVAGKILAEKTRPGKEVQNQTKIRIEEQEDYNASKSS